MGFLAIWVGGCATSVRLGVAPTVDTHGAWGGVVTAAIALGETYRRGRAAIFGSADLSGAVDERARARGNAGHLGLGLGVDALGESPHFGFRIGLLVAGRAVLPTGAAGGAVGARLALLPVVRLRHVGRPPERCGEAESWTFWHVGLEASGQYLFGPDARGWFSFGPVFELDALSIRVCE